jgi:hypothetical protein
MPRPQITAADVGAIDVRLILAADIKHPCPALAIAFPYIAWP